VRCGGSRRRQRVPGAERDAPRPMNRDVPPCIRALRASLQPLIGGAIECVRRAVALVRKRSIYIRRRGTRSMGAVIYPSCLLLRRRPSTTTPNTLPLRPAADRRRHVRTRLPPAFIRPSRLAPDADARSAQLVLPSRYPCTSTPRPRAGGSS
jgi:hypothetical protein